MVAEAVGVCLGGKHTDVAFIAPEAEEAAGIEGEIFTVPSPGDTKIIRCEGGGICLVAEVLVHPILEGLQFVPAEAVVSIQISEAVYVVQDWVGDAGLVCKSGHSGVCRTWWWR